MVTRNDRAQQYAEGQWEEILSRITSTVARGFLSGMRETIVGILKRAYLEGADDAPD